MADPYPKSREELEAENVALRADVYRLQASVASLQSTVIARETEIGRLRKPKPKPRVLDPDAADAFQRPARLR